MKKIRNDLWETRAYSPFPGLTTHAYLWTPPSGQNVLFYSTGTDDDFDEIEDLGGIAHQYLSHQDEAGPVLAQIAQRFGARLHTPAPEVDAIRRFAEPHVQFEHRHVDDHGGEVIPTPGHSPGSTCFLVPGADASTYLFTGDTVFLADNGVWTAGSFPTSATLTRWNQASSCSRPSRPTWSSPARARTHSAIPPGARVQIGPSPRSPHPRRGRHSRPYCFHSRPQHL
ncbi:MAG: MBL fold metallo-hydrolase [Pseudonocardiaceae bacterium]